MAAFIVAKRPTSSTLKIPGLVISPFCVGTSQCRCTFPSLSVIISNESMVKTRSSRKDGSKPPSTPPPSSSKKLPPSSKQKNRVAAAKSPPLVPLAPPTLEPSDQESVSSHSTTSSRSSQGPLPLNLLKQLAQDIEKGGGIESFKGSEQKVSTLCNDREDVFGRRGHPIRRRIQQQVFRWQTLHQEGTYIDDVLNRLKVKSFSNLQFEKRENQNKTVTFSDSDSSDSSIGSSSSDNSPAPERLLEKGNSPATPRNVETRRAPRQNIEEKKNVEEKKNIEEKNNIEENNNIEEKKKIASPLPRGTSTLIPKDGGE